MDNQDIPKPKKPWPVKKSILFVGVTFFVFVMIALAFFMYQDPKEVKTEGVLSSTITESPTPIEKPATASASDISPTDIPKTKDITVALYGDSMIDTMGDSVDVLSSVLERKYPHIAFTFYNYGIGAQNIESGLSRFDSPYVYKERNFPSVPSLNPDVLIIGTFSYNPLNPHDPSRNIHALTSLLQKAKQTGSKVYLLVEIAPLSTEFGKGEKGVNWSDQEAANHAAKIQENLEVALDVGRSLAIPVIDAYTGSKTSNTKGNPRFVNDDDGIHPSYEGHLYTADQIAKTVKID